MLENGNFEQDWGDDKSHDVLVCRPGQTPTLETRDNIFSPKSWKAWFYHTPDAPIEERYSQPEVKDAWRHVDPRRVHTGEKGILFFTFYRRHWGGFLQQVDVEKGKRYEANVYTQAWSNHDGPEFPHPHDGRWSEGAGYDEVAWIEGSQPHDTDDKQQDAKANFTFKIGIDPTGGTDPMSNDIIWGDGYHIYNGYVKQLSVKATAQANTITVFLSSKTLWTFCHTDAYFDDVTLTEIEDEPPPYDCVTLVLPQDATPEQLAEILTLAYPNRRSFMFSHDDAGRLGGLTKLYNIPLADHQRYLDWYATKYPQTTVEFAQTSDWNDDGLLLGQCDEPWRLQRYGDGGGPTYCAKGCWLCACAMALRYLGIDATATPLTVDAAVGHDGYDANYAMTWAAMPRAGLKVLSSTTSDAVARAHLDAGGVCFAEVLPVSLQHFVMVTRYEGSRFWMYDPWKRVACWVDEKYDGVESWRLIQPAETPVPPPPPPPNRPLIGLHLQALEGGALDYVHRVKPRVMKIFQAENAELIKIASPETLVVLRYYTPDQPLGGDLARSAWDYVASFADTLRTHAEHIDYVESWNETVPSCNAEAIRRAVEFDCHFADALAARGFGVAPVLLNVAVGNPYHEGGEIELLLPAVAKAIQYRGVIAYHAYHLFTDMVAGPGQDWKYYAGRWEQWDKVFVAHGYYPRYIFGECGAFANCNAGWRDPLCCGGDWDKYQAQILEFQRRLVTWNATHGDRALGGTIFTICPTWMNWSSFRITEPEMVKLAQALTA